MSKIVAIVSSPRKNANTDFLVNTAANAAKENGNDVEIFYLNTMTNKKGCQGCDACKKNGGSCITKDDLTPVLDAIRDADGVIL
ncbi:MAG: flavodoxin family protein, partial [Candidatus Methanomethylophilaceae archaeon]|nr:flavodoxin family protein [Candidatus Methanomethylophilaceae archaeon]